jgi:predicted nucleic acid-binding protein
LREKFKFDPEVVSRLLVLIRDVGPGITPKPAYTEMPDESDRKFYEVAKTAGARLVTGNKKHYPKAARIMSPAELYADYGE